MIKPKALLFGASEGGRNILINHSKTYNFLAYVDNDKRKHGARYAGLPVIAPDDISDYEIDEIIISSTYGPHIHRQLVNQIGIPANVIIRRVPVELLETNWQREFAAFVAATSIILGIVTLMVVAI